MSMKTMKGRYTILALLAGVLFTGCGNDTADSKVDGVEATEVSESISVSDTVDSENVNDVDTNQGIGQSLVDATSASMDTGISATTLDITADDLVSDDSSGEEVEFLGEGEGPFVAIDEPSDDIDSSDAVEAKPNDIDVEGDFNIFP